MQAPQRRLQLQGGAFRPRRRRPSVSEVGMQHSPSFSEFVELARGATVVPIYRQLIGDTLTPVSAFCKIQEGDWSFLFESVVGGERVGRYSFLGSGPFLRFEAYGNRVRIEDSTGARESEH